MKVTVYTRDPITRSFRRAKAKVYKDGTVFALRSAEGWETLGRVSFEEAKIAASERELDIHKWLRDAGAPQAQPAKPNVLMLDAALNDYFQFISTRALATRQCYGLVLRQFLRVVKDNPVREIGQNDLAAYHRFLKSEGFSDRTCSNRLVNITTFLRHNGITGVTLKVKYTEKKVSAYRPDELKALLAAATPDEWLLFQFLLTTGCREQEAMHAKREDIDFVDKIILVREIEKDGEEWKPKDREERELPIPDFLLAVLKGRGKGLLFPTPKGKLDSHMLRIVKQVAKRAGLPGVWTLHKFRKSFATIAHKSGVDPRTIQRRLAHSSLETSLAYLEGEDARSDRSRDQTNKAFSAFA